MFRIEEIELVGLRALEMNDIEYCRELGRGSRGERRSVFDIRMFWVFGVGGVGLGKGGFL